MNSTLVKWWAFFLSLLFTTIAISGYISKGESHIVEADEHLEGIKVECFWTSHLKTLHGGNYTNAMREDFMVSSGAEFNCGFSWEAAIMHYGKPSIRLSHDTHSIIFISKTETGTKVYRATMREAIKKKSNFKSATGYEWLVYLTSLQGNLSSNKSFNPTVLYAVPLRSTLYKTAS